MPYLVSFSLLDDSEKQITPRRLSSYDHLFLDFAMLGIVSERELGLRA
ncbi:MAG: hypothetical protein V3T91_01515 [Candidatus Bipolaricaulota bacterium]